MNKRKGASVFFWGGANIKFRDKNKFKKGRNKDLLNMYIQHVDFYIRKK
jgi:hypothetical protein